MPQVSWPVRYLDKLQWRAVGRGAGQFVIWAYKQGKGGGAVCKPPFLADIICELPLTHVFVCVKKTSNGF